MPSSWSNPFVLSAAALLRVCAALPLLLLNPALPAGEERGHVADGADFV